MKGLAIVILAAGQGTRMKSGRAKVLHHLLGRPMLSYPVETARSLKPERIVVVVGVQGDQVMDEFKNGGVAFAEQKERLGTGHAVMSALPKLKGFKGDVLVLYGDCPLMTEHTLGELARLHRRRKAAVTLLTATLDKPKGYGRIIMDNVGRVRAIVEEKDCDEEQRKINLINPGIYLFDHEFLKRALPMLKNDNRQGEYYLTDLLGMAVREKLKVASMEVPDWREILGVNSRMQLAEAADVLRDRIVRAHCDSGVTIESPATVRIEPGVEIGVDAVIEAGARLTGATAIGKRVVIEANCRLHDTEVEKDAVIEAGSRLSGSRVDKGARIKTGTVVEDSRVREGAQVGPMAHLRPGSDIGADARIGNYVETKKARIGKGSKASHLTYIGDAEVGAGVNIGCGFITCNYDGANKWLTVIEDGVFVGSDSQTVAPVTIGKGAYVGSGTTLTRDVPPESLAITRAPLVVKEDWAPKKRAELDKIKKKKTAVKKAAKKSAGKTKAKKPAARKKPARKKPARKKSGRK